MYIYVYIHSNFGSRPGGLKGCFRILRSGRPCRTVRPVSWQINIGHQENKKIPKKKLKTK